MRSLFFDKFGAMFDEKVVFLFIEYCDRLTQWADFLGCWRAFLNEKAENLELLRFIKLK